jgi:hypothetical protein
MDPIVWIVIVVAAVVIVAVVVALALRARRSRRLRERFGPEYERAEQAAGSRKAAEAELRAREKRHGQLDIRPLEDESRRRHVLRWQGVQTMFVDETARAVRDADVLVIEIMRERGYPMDRFEQRAADISVEHPQVVEHYRRAHGVRVASDRERVETEELRQALVHYRALVTELLGPFEAPPQPGTPEAQGGTGNPKAPPPAPAAAEASSSRTRVPGRTPEEQHSDRRHRAS